MGWWNKSPVFFGDFPSLGFFTHDSCWNRRFATTLAEALAPWAPWSQTLAPKGAGTSVAGGCTRRPSERPGSAGGTIPGTTGTASRAWRTSSWGRSGLVDSNWWSWYCFSTPRKINIEPGNDGLEDDFPLPGGPYCQVPAVHLSGCNDLFLRGSVAAFGSTLDPKRDR